MFAGIFLGIMLVVVNVSVFAETVTIKSPDGTLEMQLSDTGGLSYSVKMDGEPIILNSKMELELSDGAMLGRSVQIISNTASRFGQIWQAVVGNKSEIADHYHQNIISLRENNGLRRQYSIECRAYNDGVAFRYVFDRNFSDTVNITQEHSEFVFSEDYTCWPAFLNSYTTEQQALYPKENLSSFSIEDIIGPPLTIQLASNRYCSITEAALTDWAGLYITRSDQYNLLVESNVFVGGGAPFVFSRQIPDTATKIRIIISDVDGNYYDHVDIVNAKFVKDDGEIIWLSDLEPVTVRQGWGNFTKDRSVYGNPLRIAGKQYSKGLGTHSAAVIDYEIPKGCVKVSAAVGIDSEVKDKGKAKFKLYAIHKSDDDKIVLKSTLSRLDDGKIPVQVKTPHVSPWRVMMLGRKPADLVNSDIIVNLNEPCKIQDTSWIKPGVSSWHWLSCGSKMDMDLLKSFIDLSASMGWEYSLIDDGWYSNGDCTSPIDILDIPALVDYAANKNVRLWLWVHWQVLDRQLEEAFDLYEKWGIAGLKIDFMSRDDQWMVNWYQKVLKSAAEHQLMIGFHGCYKPTGICRTWPNLLTREAVFGAEQVSPKNDPLHRTTLPFTRMLAGAMDYTPGTMWNMTAENWSSGRPLKTIGTRCQELAICMIYDSPLLVMGDKPENYNNQAGIEFLKNLPTSWDDTRVLDGAIGEFITMARRKGDMWYLASITTRQRSMEVPLDFLKGGSYKLVLFEDGPAAATTDARDTNRRQMTVAANDVLSVKMAAGGGFAAVITKEQK